MNKRQKWVRADKLEPGDRVQDANGNVVTIKDVSEGLFPGSILIILQEADPDFAYLECDTKIFVEQQSRVTQPFEISEESFRWQRLMKQPVLEVLATRRRIWREANLPRPHRQMDHLLALQVQPPLTEPILNCEPKQSDQCTALTNVRIAVLLVSSDFLYSEFIHDNELGPLLKRAEEGGIALVVDQSHMPGYSGSPGYLSIVH